jgi:beta-galactosidase
MYIIIGVVLSLIMALLFNSKRKFREDATRALLRPYNFYADIRDHRILSGIHATILMLILSSAMSLFLSSLLFYFKDSKFIEQILLSFGSENLISLYGYLAWNPIEGLIYLFIISVMLVLLTSAVIKLASFFIKTKVFYSSIFFMVIWSSLPLAILLPLILVLYRILAAEVINLYILIFIGIYFLWLFQRLIKGIYVIFDVNRIAVYFYAFVFMFLIIGSFVFFYQLNYSTFYYIKNSLMQFGII